MKAMIFAAGLGTRLGEISRRMPKALIDINGKSILQIAVENVSRYGFDDIIVNIHHFADLMEKEVEKLRKLNFNITISDERKLLLETGGGLNKAAWFFDKDPFLVYNVDIITDLDLSDLYRYHIEKGGIATIAVRDRPGRRFFLVNESGLLKGWCNNETGEKIIVESNHGVLTEKGFSGIHIINPEIFAHMVDGVYSITPLYLRLAKSYKIFTYGHDEGFWADIGTAENLEYVRKYFG